MIDKLSFLEGTWTGFGTARFPSISTTEYIETLEFRITGDGESILYEQRSWHKSPEAKGKPLHFESGYIVECKDGSFDLLNAQNSNRVEVLKCTRLIIESSKSELTFESRYFGNDGRMKRTQRDYIIEGNTLNFRMCMATQDTPEFQEHLRSVLVRSGIH